ncbi:hypothetical protein HID58_009072 [Brassica napus]|uniref:Non-specific lipid-transfer protein n=1 Tax=Brassica napus TaxID=3708 RepID=A0ABQ8DRH0_BRANA|nr:non-specific lipid-transfer protein 3-like [Brassica napus]KAH0931955.1 hypothetical protein HID58_009072 [Brassica napus]
MVSALRFFTCLVLAVCIVASVDAAISCDTVVSSLGTCYVYLRQGGIVPSSCCGGVRNLNGMAQTTPDRQQACKCVQSFTKSVPGFNQNIAYGLPGKCGVSLPYPISNSMNCDNVKLSGTHVSS